MEELNNFLYNQLLQGGLLVLPLALLGGVITALNPCCFPLYPIGATICCATREQQVKLNFFNTFLFITGIALAVTLLGIVAAVAGRTLTGLGGWGYYFIALIPLLMGLHILNLVRIPVPAASLFKIKRIEAFFTGFLLSLIIVPCGTPILAALLSYAAYQGNIYYGGIMLFFYGLGIGVPLLLLGTTVGSLAQKLDKKGWNKVVNQVAGCGLIIISFILLIRV